MLNIEFKESISETLDILEYMDKKYIDRIPIKFLNFLKENKSTTYEPNLDHSKKINEMNLKDKTKDILAIIYMKFWCNSQEKIEYKNLLKQNEIQYQKKLREKYNPDNIFKKKS